jgi:hypothetical protein
VLDVNGISDSIEGLASASNQTTGVVQQGTANLTLDAASGDNSYYGTITGSGTLTKNGAATARLRGNNTLGAVNVNDGALFFTGSNTTGPVTVNGGTLGGGGSVSGAVALNSSAHLAPGDVNTGIFTAGALTLNAGSVLDMELGVPIFSDKISVGGQLTLNGGSIDISNFNGQLDYTTYTLINYGTLVGSVNNLTLANNVEGFAFKLVDTGSSINLQVTVPGVPGDFNNDGVVDSSDYLVWQKYRNRDVDLPNDDDLPGPIGLAEYNLWRENFGRFAGDGGGGGGQVPEPAVAMLIALAGLGLACRRPRS